MRSALQRNSLPQDKINVCHNIHMLLIQGKREMTTNMNGPQQGQDKYNAIEKTLLVLSHFAKSNSPIRNNDLAKALNINKATTSRIVKTLQKEGYLDQDPLTKEYCLGPMISSLSKSITKSLDNQTSIIAQPYCDSLRDAVSETVHFEILSGNNIYLAYTARCRNPISVAIDPGDRVYPQVHSGAKCIAAYTHPRLVDYWLQNPPPEIFHNTAIDSEVLMKEYAEINENGYAIDDGNHNLNIFSIAAPVFDNSGRAIASVVIVVPSLRKKQIRNDVNIELIKLTAKRISEKLLCPMPYDALCETYKKDKLAS